jgi:hypothetical protein
MRLNPTEAEKHLWSVLRAKRLSGFKFDRSLSIVLGSGPGGYVAAIRAAQLGPEDRYRRARESRRHLPQLGLHPHQGAAALG